MRKGIRVDLSFIYNTFQKQFTRVTETINKSLALMGKVLNRVESIQEAAKELDNKVGRIMDMVNKIVSTTKTY